MPDIIDKDDKIADLRDKLAVLETINKSLMGRVERSIDMAANSFTLFESNIVLQQAVNKQTEELQITNDRLRAEVAERKRAEEKIRASLQEKEVLLKEIHHRVKNNLQIITSLLNLQANSIADLEIREMFKDSQGRVKSMALIHEKLYRSDNLAEINFSDYVESLHRYLMSTISGNRGRIMIISDIDDIVFSVDKAVPCGLIINELVTNSLKHAFVNNLEGKITIACKKLDKDLLSLSVSDNGIGISSDIDYENTPSLGLQLVHSLTNQLGGEIELKSKPGNTIFVIKFKGE